MLQLMDKFIRYRIMQQQKSMRLLYQHHQYLHIIRQIIISVEVEGGWPKVIDYPYDYPYDYISSDEVKNN